MYLHLKYSYSKQLLMALSKTTDNNLQGKKQEQLVIKI